MRELKFRAWDREKKKMFTKVLIGNTTDSSSQDYVAHAYYDHEWKNFDEMSEVDVMQWTGLTDKSGKPIYEGDILNIDGVITGAGMFTPGFMYDNLNVPVVWDNENALWSYDVDNHKRYQSYYAEDDDYAMFQFRNHTRQLMFGGDKCHVIGNIYESQELLNQ